MSKYEKDMVGEHPIPASRALNGQKQEKNNSSIKAKKMPYDASNGQYLAGGGSARKKMAVGGSAKVRKGMMSKTGKPLR